MKLEGITPRATHEQVAEELYRCGLSDRILSRERIRQIEVMALRKFFQGFLDKGYTADDLLDDSC